MTTDKREEPEPLESRLEAWLKEQGYPLEFATARAFRSPGLGVHQGYYGEAEGDARCEVDVVATGTPYDGARYARVALVVECKWSGDKPWIVFLGQQAVRRMAEGRAYPEPFSGYPGGVRAVELKIRANA